MSANVGDARGWCDTVSMSQGGAPRDVALSTGLQQPLRFAVVEPLTGNRSATWRVWTGRKGDGAYLCESVTGGDWKACKSVGVVTNQYYA